MKRKMYTRLGIALIASFIALSGYAVFSEPGGTDDPVVTKSYIVEKVVPEIKAYVDEQLGLASSDDNTTAKPLKFVVVNVKEGQTVTCESGTEMILRMGSGTIIATDKGGIADTTIGYDLGNGTSAPSNHLLVVPVADGRGFKATSDAILLIKGGYKLK